MEELKEQIKQVLFEMLQNIQMYQIEQGYTIFEADYETSAQKIIDLINQKSGSN